MADPYRKELVQVAAVVIAMIETRDKGSANLEALPTIVDELWTERANQNRKWGAQSHEPSVWLAILMEEVGEAAQAWLREAYEGGDS